MPTPNNDALPLQPRPLAVAVHSACPDVECIDPAEWPTLGEAVSPVAGRRRATADALRARPSLPTPPADESMPNDAEDASSAAAAAAAAAVIDDSEPKADADVCLSPEPRSADARDAPLLRPHINPAATYLIRDPNPSPTAWPSILPPPPRPLHTSSFLRPGSRFVGKQQSDKQVYKVEVTLKSVDVKESFLCGYLRIEGLTKDHPTLTTYFEGEIIGSKYTFQTKHEAWGATEKTDMQHWARFPAWRPLATQAKRADFHYKNYMEKENIFMRWKEYFLVPDHRVREIHGASFEGFYYICFNQVKGIVSGIYFHSKSEKFQQLDLEFVPDMGGFAAIEFR